jgi:hypothetical protein
MMQQVSTLAVNYIESGDVRANASMAEDQVRSLLGPPPRKNSRVRQSLLLCRLPRHASCWT